MSVQDVLISASEQGVFFYLKNNNLAYKVKKNTLSPALKEQIKHYRVEIKAYLESTAKKNRFILPPVLPADRTKPLPLSYSQQRLWFIDQLEQGSLQYNIQGHLLLQGKLNVGAFKQALTSLLDRHEVLRTHFTMEEGQARQVIVEAYDLPLTQHNLSEFSDEEKLAKVQQLKHTEAKTAFNLSKDLMLRVHLLMLSNKQQLVLYTMHHIASDGWSAGILRNEFGVLYEAYCNQQQNPLTPLEIQYVDYAVWQRQWLQGEVLEQQLNYWKKQLAGIPNVHSLCLDKARPLQQHYEGRAFYQAFDKQTTKTIFDLCTRHGVTLFMFLQSAFAVLLSRYSNETDIVVGSPMVGRTHKDMEALIGFFINTLVLRTDVSSKRLFSELLQENKNVVLDAYTHQHIPFEMLVEEIRPERNISHNALFQILFVVQNNETEKFELPLESVVDGEKGLSSVSNVNIRFDLALHVAEFSDQLLVNWSYRDCLFEDNTVARMATNFAVLLDSIIEGLNPFQKEPCIESLRLLDKAEQNTLLLDWNKNTVNYPQGQCIHELFEKQVTRTPNLTAVIFEDKQMTYKQLNEQSNRLAHYLIEQGVKPDTLVALSIKRSFDTMIALLGILKSGAAYVPLDPEYPQTRLNYMLTDCAAPILLTHTNLLENIAINQQHIICLDDPVFQTTLKTYTITNPQPASIQLTPDHCAYVIYTSGSTGQPKGVVVNHASVCNFLHCAKDLFLSKNIKGAVVSSPLAFDATVQSLYLPLCAGKYVELLPENELLLSNLADYLIDDEDALLFKITPTHLKALSNQHFVEKNPEVKHVIVVAGEPLNQDTLKPWQTLLPGATFINEYGPTEATVGSCTFLVTNDFEYGSSNQSVPIGRPLANVQFYVLDNYLNVQPIGAAGELYIGGAGLAREYLHQPVLTNKKFIPHPFSHEPGQRLYRTGDLVRYLPDGNMEFLGRIDDQVKIRGFRIELGEIENLLLQHELVQESVVLARDDDLGDKRLVAYVVLASTANTSDYQTLLRNYLQETLPEYMIPAAYVCLETLPLTPNNKVDKNALPDPQYGAYVQTDYIAPSTKTETLLADIWANLLQLDIETISTNANFFALGGHSLLVMKLLARLQEHDLYTDIRTVFNNTTLGELAYSLDHSENTTKPFTAPPNLIPADCEQITPELLSLVNLNESEITQIVSKVPGGTKNIQDIYPLAPLQEGILFHHLLNPAQDPYLLSNLFLIEQQEWVDNLLEALQLVVNRHDVLRTAIISDGLPTPVQVVQRKVKLEVNHITLASDTDLQSQLVQLNDQLPTLVLSEAPLLRVLIASTDQGAPSYLLLQSHHVISDHVGNEILWSEVQACLNGQAEQLPVSVPYREFVAHVLHQSEQLNAKDYFTKQLRHINEPTLPFALMDVRADGRDVERADEILHPVLSRTIRDVAQNLHLSPASIFHAAWAIVIAACSARDEVVFGTVLSGRLQGTSGAERMLGLFINTLPLRVNLRDCTVRQLVEETDLALKTLLNYEQTPLALAQSCSGVSNELPLFSALLNYRHSSKSVASKATAQKSTDIRGLGGGQGKTNYPFTLSVSDWGEEFSIRASIVRSIKAEQIVHYVKTAITNLVEMLLNAEQAPLSKVSILPALERQQLLSDWNNTQVNYPKDKCIHELFEEQVTKTPNLTAVFFEDKQMTYKQLNEQSNRLAHYLIEQGVKPDSLVALSIKRSFDTMVALLAILKSGAAYVPLDPEYPQARLDYMLTDCAAPILLTHTNLLENMSINQQHIICLDDPVFQSTLKKYAITNPQPSSIQLTPDHCAYVIYTSGSTGQAKGVVVNHASVCNFLYCTQALFLNKTIKGSVVSSPLAFDATVQSLYLPLCAGKYVKILPENDQLLSNLADNLVNNKDSLLFKITPTHLKALSNQHYVEKNLKLKHVVVVAGEPLNQDTLKPWQALLPRATFINEYGPTEATVGCCTFLVNDSFDFSSSNQRVPIGRPLANVQFYVLDNALNVQPLGTTGELYIGGAGLAREYLHQPALTNEKFIPHPFSDEPGQRLYRTGDLVRYLPDGNVEFLGRIDDQIKIRGFRIELGEIQSLLLQHNIVKETVVLAREDKAGDKRLVAYVVLANTVNINDYHTQLRSYLQESLPQYMVPSAYVCLETLPLTPNGKIDKNALPAPQQGAYIQTTYIAPTTKTEKLLVNIWTNLLQLDAEAISTNANFFALGGHSLLVMKLLARLQEHDLYTDVRTIVTIKTLGELASTLDQSIIHKNLFTAPPNLIPADCEQITPDLLTLLNLSESDISKIVSTVPGGAKNIQDIYPLAPLQEGILFHHLLNPERDPYVVGNLFVIENQNTVDELINALQSVIDRHDVLRTAIMSTGLSTPVQVVQRQAKLVVHYITLPPDTDFQSELQAQMLRDQLPALLLSDAPLLRVLVASAGQGSPCYFYQQSHHIISDHVSSAILRSEVQAYLSGQAEQLPASEPYREFVAHALHLAEDLNAQEYFTEQLGHIIEPTLPFALMDVQGDGRAVEQANECLTAPLSRTIRELAQNLKMSPASLFHAAWALVVAACSARDEVVFGTVLSGRLQGTVGAERMLGLFMNTLPIRINLRGQFVKQLVEQTDTALKTLLNYEQTPLALTQSCSGVSNEVPLFSALLNYRHSSKGGISSMATNKNEAIRSLGGEGRTNYPFMISVSDWGDEFSLHANIVHGIGAARVVNYLITAITGLVDALHSTTQVPVYKLSILPALERQQLLLEYSDTQVDYAQESCIHTLFEAQVEKTPEAIALVFEQQQLSYGQLNARSNQLAHYLIEQGVGPEVRVGICVKRSLDMLIGLLGVLKAGACYVPIDPHYPSKRVSYLIENSGVQLILTQSTVQKKTEQKIHYVNLDTDVMCLYATTNPQIRLNPLNLVYVIYTSGSTGEPKGVLITHKNLNNLATFQSKQYQLDHNSRVLQFASLSFDAASWDWSMALLSGSVLHLLPEETVKSPEQLNRLVKTQHITYSYLPPALLNLLNLSDFTSMTTLTVGGESPSLETIKNWLSGRRLFNAYGPTENTVVATTSHITTSATCLPIGKPIENVTSYVLNSSRELVPQGVTGELYLGGEGLSRGFIEQAGLTAEKFIPHPFSQTKGERLYRTGDLVQYLPNADLVFIGRIDNQVKIRGLRIELAEVERVLLQHEHINDVVVSAQEKNSGDKSLVAYFVLSKTHNAIQAAEALDYPTLLRSYLLETLPQYMIPAAYVCLESLPLTRNGKVDKNALPDPEPTAYVQSSFSAPNTKTEKLLADLWADLLQLNSETISTTASFFALGGHSLLVMKLLAQLQEYNIYTDLGTVYNAASLGELAHTLDHCVNNTQPFTAPINLIPVGCEQITPELLPLVNLSESEITQIVSRVPGGATNIQDIYPLAPLQEGILFHHLLEPKQDPYVLSNLFYIENPQLVDDLLVALQSVVDRHDVLRTAIISDDMSEPVQVVQRQAKLAVHHITLESSADTQLQLWTLKDRLPALLLSEAPLLRVLIASTGLGSPCYFLQQSHHIIMDHVGKDILREEVQAYLSGQADKLPPSVPYREFVAHAIDQAQHLDAKTYFTQQLGDINEPTLPFGLIDVRGDGRDVERAEEILPPRLSRNIRALAQNLDMSPASLFHAAWAMVIAACSARDDVVFGTVLSGRLQGTVGAERMLGLFINTLPVRINLRECNARQLVEQTDTTLKAVLKYEQASLTLAQGCSGVANQMPLFSALLNYRHSSKPVSTTDLTTDSTTDSTTAPTHQNQAIQSLGGAGEQSNYPFMLAVSDWGEEFSIKAVIDQKVQAQPIVHYLITAITNLVETLQHNENIPSSRISILPTKERQQLLLDWNDTRLDYPQDYCIHQLFEAQAKKNPNTIALLYANQQLSYGELNFRSNQLAHYLISQGVGPEKRVGICVERSIEMVIGIMGILKAGACYVPLDPGYPAKRLAYLIKDSAVKLIVTQKNLQTSLGLTQLLKEQNVNTSCALVDIDKINDQRETFFATNNGLTNPSVSVQPTNLAYVIYTSGSTGEPKGVGIEHKGVVSLLSWSANQLSVEDRQGVLASTSLCFDLSVYELFLPLISGTQSIIINSILSLEHLPQQHQISLINTVPSAAKALLEQAVLPESLRVINLAGEALKPSLVNSLYQSGCVNTVYDLYGPSEATTYSTFTLRTLNGPEAIGNPVANTQAYVLDSQGEVAALGAVGELYLGGVGLARAYINQGSLSAEKFVPNPFSNIPGERLYRTGDLVRYLSDGKLAFIGRIDHQVKLRGLRIELGEIESVLLQHEQVKDAVVLARENDLDTKHLVAYVIQENTNSTNDNESTELTIDTQILCNELRTLTQLQLPAYMVPLTIVVLEVLPLTSNGKVDRNALLAIDTVGLQVQEYVAPNTETECVLVDIWSDILFVPADKIGIYDSFFNLGGHSLLAIKLVSQINKTLETHIVLSDIFRMHEIVKLASYIDELKSGKRDNQLDIERLSDFADVIDDQDIEEFDL